jgi:hypothetical protein
VQVQPQNAACSPYPALAFPNRDTNTNTKLGFVFKIKNSTVQHTQHSRLSTLVLVSGFFPGSSSDGPCTCTGVALVLSILGLVLCFGTWNRQTTNGHGSSRQQTHLHLTRTGTLSSGRSYSHAHYLRYCTWLLTTTASAARVWARVSLGHGHGHGNL